VDALLGPAVQQEARLWPQREGLGVYAEEEEEERWDSLDEEEAREEEEKIEEVRTLLALLLPKDRGDTQFTCFTGTKVQMLTQQFLRPCARKGRPFSGGMSLIKRKIMRKYRIMSAMSERGGGQV
jgi:hypothetical protein